jgi:hypothetical protein
MTGKRYFLLAALAFAVEIHENWLEANHPPNRDNLREHKMIELRQAA